jgi:hypothetical protein
MHIKTIGLDLAKSVFQAHGVDEAGDVVLVKKLHRKQMVPFFSKLPPCLIGIEACATAHHWARTLTAMGHEVRIMPPAAPSKLHKQAGHMKVTDHRNSTKLPLPKAASTYESQIRLKGNPNDSGFRRSDLAPPVPAAAVAKDR